MAISIEDLRLAAERARRQAEESGELRPRRIGRVAVQLPDAIRAAVVEDLVTGEYERAASEATAGDAELRRL